MTIYAQRTTFRSSAQMPDFKITRELEQGQILIYDNTLRAFINVDCSTFMPGSGSGGSGSPTTGIAGAVNLGLGAKVFKAVDLTDNLEFRTLLGGPGINVAEGSDEIEITNTIVTDACISVDDSFKIEIDNDNTTFDTALFEIYSNRNPAIVDFTPIIYNAAPFDIEVITDPTFTLPGQYKTTNGDFIALGFAPGMCIKVAGTTEQDGIHEIASVTNDTITITNTFFDATDNGLQPATTIEGLFFKITSNSIISLGYDFISQGFVVGQTLNVSGTPDNDGVYTIASVTQDTITINETFTGTLGCTVSNINLSVPAISLPTGWSVNELGQMTTNDTVVCGNLSIGCGGELNVEGNTTFDSDINVGGDLYVGGTELTNIITGLLPTFPNNGLLTQTSSGVFTSRELTGGTGIIVNNADGIAANPEIVADDFQLTLSGDVQGSETIVSLTDTTMNVVLSDIGVGGTFNKVVVDSKGRVVSGINQEIEGGPGITVVNGDGVIANPIIHPDDFNIIIDGDATGIGTVTDLSNTTITLTLANVTGLTAGDYNRVVVDSKGRVTSGTNQPIIGTNGINVLNGSGLLGDPTISANDFDITIIGDVTGTQTVNGLTDTTINVELADVAVAGTYNEVTVDSKGRVILGNNTSTQSYGPNITTLDNATYSNGFMIWTGLEYRTKEIQGTLNQIEVVEGSGTTGNTILSLSDNIILPGSSSVTIPKGVNAQRNTIAQDGEFRYNTEENYFEGYNNGVWEQFAVGDFSNYLPLTGGTMLGDIIMDNNDIITSGLIDGRNISSDGLVLDNLNIGTGIKVQIGAGNFVNREINATNGIIVTNGDGVLGNPTLSANDFDLNFIGDVSGVGTVTSLSNTSIPLTLNPTGVTPGNYNSITVGADGRVTNGSTVSLNFQPLDTELTTLASGMSGLGFVVWNGSTYTNRLVTGTTNEITVSESNGSLGNATIGLTDNPIIPGTGALTFPIGQSLERPASPVNGMGRYNSDIDDIEFFINGSWNPFINTITGGFLSLTGGTMSGDIDMDENNILSPGLVDGRDIAVDGLLLDTINTGVGIKVQTAPNTFVNRTINSTTNSGIVITNNNGVAGNPIIEVDISTLTIASVIDGTTDLLMFHDSNIGQNMSATLNDLVFAGAPIVDVTSLNTGSNVDIFKQINNRIIEIRSINNGNNGIVVDLNGDTVEISVNSTLEDISNLVPGNNEFIVGNGTSWTTETGLAARNSLGLGTIATEDQSSYLNVNGGTMVGQIDMSNFKITDLANPTNGNEAATKDYVDGLIGAGTTPGAGLTQTGSDFDINNLDGSLIINPDDIAVDLTFMDIHNDARYVQQIDLTSVTPNNEGADLVGTDTKTNLDNATTVEEALTAIDNKIPFALQRFRQDITGIWNLDISSPNIIVDTVNDVETARFPKYDQGVPANVAIYKDMLLPPDYDSTLPLTLYISLAKEVPDLGNIQMSLSWQHLRAPGFTPHEIVSFEPGATTQASTISWTIPANTFQPLDMITLRLSRLGADQGDTYLSGSDFFAALLTQ